LTRHPWARRRTSRSPAGDTVRIAGARVWGRRGGGGCALAHDVPRDPWSRAHNAAGNAVADAGPTVAAYDVSRDLAVLKLPSARADSLTVSPALAEGQNAWGFGLGSCRVPGDAPIAVSWADRQHGVLRLKGSVPGAVP